MHVLRVETGVNVARCYKLAVAVHGDANLLAGVADLTAMAIAVGVIGARLWRYRRIRLDPTILFCLGHAYYLSGAGLSYRLRLLPSAFENAYRLIDRVPADRQAAFSLWSLGLLVTFLVGSHVARLVPVASRRPTTPAIDGRAPALALVAVSFALFAFVCFTYRTTILMGYRLGDIAAIQNTAGRGLVSAVATGVALTILFLRHHAFQLEDRRPIWIREIPYVAGLMPVVAVLLIAGGRLYATTFVVAAAVWTTIARRGIRRSVVLGGGIAGVLALSALGSLRVGQVPSPGDIAEYGAAESVLVSISPAIYLESSPESFQAVRLPRYLATDVVNAVPRVVLPNKNDLQRTPEEDGFAVESSLGGVSVGSSLLVNFGWLGSLVMLGLFGYVTQRLWLRAVANPDGWLTVGLSVALGAIPMSLFRDKFSVSLVRWMLLTGIIQTSVCYVAIRLAARPLRRRATPRATNTTAWVPNQQAAQATALR